MSPVDIVRHIQFDPILEQITISQVYNLKARYNQNMLGNVKVNLMEFTNICETINLFQPIQMKCLSLVLVTK